MVVVGDLGAVTEGKAVSGIIATFPLASGCGAAECFRASIGWGDESTGLGVVQVASDNSAYTVTGAHTWPAAGQYTLVVQVFGIDGSIGVGARTIAVDDAPLTAWGMTLTGMTSVPISGFIATLIDANAYATAASFDASIDWGDGSTTGGQVVAWGGVGGNSGLAVTGTHTYATPSTYAVTVHIVDHGGATVLANSTVTIAGPPTETPTATPSPTLMPTATWTATATPTPSPTSTPSYTPLPTSTPSPSYTPSPTLTSTMLLIPKRSSTATPSRLAVVATPTRLPGGCKVTTVLSAYSCRGSSVYFIDVHVGSSARRATGIFVSRGPHGSYLITTSDTVRGAKPKDVRAKVAYTYTSQIGYDVVYHVLPSKVSTTGRGVLAIVHVWTIGPPAVPWGDSGAMHAGQQAVALAFVSPQTHKLQGATGKITATKLDLHDGSGRFWLGFSATYKPFLEGAALLSSDGLLLGIVVGAGPRGTTLVFPANQAKQVAAATIAAAGLRSP